MAKKEPLYPHVPKSQMKKAGNPDAFEKRIIVKQKTVNELDRLISELVKLGYSIPSDLYSLYFGAIDQLRDVANEMEAGE